MPQVRFFALFLLALSCCPPLPAESLSLDDLVRSALAKDPGLAQASAEAESEAASLRQAAALNNPVLGLEAGSRQNSMSQGSVVGASLSQQLPFPGKRGGALQLAKLAAEASALRSKAASAALVRDLLEAALDHAAARSRWNALQERQKRLEPARAYLATQEFAAPLQKADRAVIEARFMNLEAERARLRSELPASLDQLLSLAGMDSASGELSWDLPAPEALEKLQPPSWEAVLEGNPDLKLAALQRRESAARRDQAGKAFLPDPELSLHYEREEDGEAEHRVSAGLALPLPLLEGGRHGVAAADQGTVAAEAREARLRRELQRRWKVLSRRMEAAREAAHSYSPSNLERLGTQLAAAERELKRGRLPLLSYLELVDEAAQTRESMTSLSAEALRAEAEILSLAGASAAPTAWIREARK